MQSIFLIYSSSLAVCHQVSESDNSAVYNKNDVRDGESGTQNYAMLSAKSCEGQFSSSDCSSQSWAEIILETEFGTNVKLVNISIEYESSRRDIFWTW